VDPTAKNQANKGWGTSALTGGDEHTPPHASPAEEAPPPRTRPAGALRLAYQRAPEISAAEAQRRRCLALAWLLGLSAWPSQVETGAPQESRAGDAPLESGQQQEGD